MTVIISYFLFFDRGLCAVYSVKHGHIELRLAVVSVKSVLLLLYVVELRVAEAEHQLVAEQGFIPVSKMAVVKDANGVVTEK